MFFRHRALTLRAATPADRASIVSLAQNERRVHLHLDWKPAEDWLGTQPYWLAEEGQRVVGALACPPDPPDTAWVRLLALADRGPADEAWDRMWEAALKQLRALGVAGTAAISLAGWLAPLLKRAGFAATHDVVVLSRQHGPLQFPLGGPARVRPAGPSDYPALIAADSSAFSAPWQHSADLLRHAFARAGYLAAAEVDGQVVGYQLSTPGTAGAHLARLAVLPAWQGRGVGAALVADMISHYTSQAVRDLTVNTQSTNAASLALYHRLGFSLTGVRFPVYQRALA